MASSDYDGGTSGKFRKRPFRRAPTTPYDRPQAEIRRANPSPNLTGGSNGWISKIVDPASRIIGRSASKLFSSVFQKRLSAPPAAQPPPGENLLSRHEAPEAACNKQKPSDKGLEQDVDVGENAVEDCDTGGIRQETLPGTYGFLELEQRLKQKTFTRAEFEHLTYLLRSRTVEPSTSNLAIHSENKEEAVVLEQVKHNGQSTVKPSTSPLGALGKEKAIVSEREDMVKSSSLHGITTYPAVNISEERVGSPTEIAKAYMGSRPSKVSPSTLGVRSQIIQEDASLLTVPYAKKSSMPLLASRHSVHFSCIPEYSANSYMTPRPRGRSALYRMSRSPYFKVPPSTNIRVGTPVRDGLSPLVPPKCMLSDGKQVLKRRSSELDIDFDSCGPTRRVHQKSNLMSPSSERHLTPPGKLLPSLTNQLDQDVNQRSASSSQKLVASVTPVPPQSTEMARKIFQELGKLEPSPKGKLSEEKGKIADSGISASAASPLEKEPTPQMTMAGESLELNTVHNMDSASGPLATGNDKHLEKSLAYSSKSIPASSSLLKGKTDANASDRPGTGKGDDSMLSASPASGPQLSPKSTASPLADRSNPKKGSLTTTVSEPTSMKIGASATAGIIEISGSDKEVKTQTDVDLYKSIGNATSSGLSTATSSVLFSIGASTGLNQSSGSLTSTSSTFPASAGTTAISNTSIKANSSSPSTAPVEPNFALTGSFQFGSGSSIGTPISVLPSRDKFDTGDTDRKSIEASPFTIISSNAPVISNACSNTNMASSALATSSVFSSICDGSTTLATSSVRLNTASGSSLLSTSSAFSSPMNGIFGVSASSQSSSSTSSFGAQQTQTGSGTLSFPHSSAVQCGSFSSGPSFGLNASSSLSSSISPFGFAMGIDFGSQSGFSSSVAGSSSSSSMPSHAQTAMAGLFSSNSLPSSSSMSACTLGSSPSLPPTGLPASTSDNLTSAFDASSGSLFSFSSVSTPTSSTSPPPSQHVFGTPVQGVGFSSDSPGSDRMNIEDRMTDDNIQAPAQSVPEFGQPDTSPPTPNFQFGHPSAVLGQPTTSPSTPSFQFGNPVPASGGSSVFQFGSQHNSTVAQNPSPFHTAGSFEFSSGGSFSLGSGGGGDKSGRRIVRAKRDKHRKK